MKILSAVERFDLVARAQSSTYLISQTRFVLAFVSLVVIFLAIGSTAPFRETLLTAIMGAACVVATLVLWTDWRYKLHALAVLCFLYPLCSALSHDHRHTNTVVGWIATLSYPLLFVYYGCGLCVMGHRYALTNGDDWEKERQQMAVWLHTLESSIRADVVEFDNGSFWTNYWTYRLLKTGDYWVIARFKRGTTRLAECRVRNSNEVVFTALPSGKWKIDILGKCKKSFNEVNPSHPSPLLNPSMRPANI